MNEHQNYLARLGHALTILNSSPGFHYSIAAMMEWTAIPARLGHIAFSRGTDASGVAYMTWAYLSDEVSAMMADNKIELLHFSEWNEGANFWIIDLVSVVPVRRPLIEMLLGQANVNDGRIIHWLSRAKGTRPAYVRRWRYRSGEIVSP